MMARSQRASRAHRWLFALTALVCFGTACASVNDGCRKQVAECIERCEATTDERGAQYEMLEPENTMSRCESQCGCRESSAPPKPAGKPTPTGNATSGQP